VDTDKLLTQHNTLTAFAKKYSCNEGYTHVCKHTTNGPICRTYFKVDDGNKDAFIKCCCLNVGNDRDGTVSIVYDVNVMPLILQIMTFEVSKIKHIMDILNSKLNLNMEDCYYTMDWESKTMLIIFHRLVMDNATHEYYKNNRNVFMNDIMIYVDEKVIYVRDNTLLVVNYIDYFMKFKYFNIDCRVNNTLEDMVEDVFIGSKVITHTLPEQNTDGDDFVLTIDEDYCIGKIGEELLMDENVIVDETKEEVVDELKEEDVYDVMVNKYFSVYSEETTNKLIEFALHSKNYDDAFMLLRRNGYNTYDKFILCIIDNMRDDVNKLEEIFQNMNHMSSVVFNRIVKHVDVLDLFMKCIIRRIESGDDKAFHMINNLPLTRMTKNILFVSNGMMSNDLVKQYYSKSSK